MSTSKLIPAKPSEVMVIRKVTSDITTLSVPFLRHARFQIGGRATLVRLPSGSVAVFSPVALTDDVKKTVAGMGEVKYIIAPDMEHHIFLGPWHAAYPTAKVLGPSGLASKRTQQNNEPVPFAVEYHTKDSTTPNSVPVDPEFDSTFDSAYVSAHPNKELVYNHRPSGTLIQADLLFNLPALEQNSKQPGGGGLYSAAAGGNTLWTRLFTSFMNTQGDAIWTKRFIWYALSRGDRPGFSRQVSAISEWKFDRMIPCHGDVIESGAKEVYRKMFQWHLDFDKASKKEGSGDSKI